MMKQYFCILILLIFLLPETKVFGAEFDFGGYVYTLPIYQRLPSSAEFFGVSDTSKDVLTELTRIRIRPSLYLSEEMRITLHYELDLIFSNVLLPYQVNYGKTNRQLVDLHNKFYEHKIGSNWKLTLEHFIDLLYWKYVCDFGELVIGRQVISWGVGRIWQVTDLFNSLNPAVFSKFEKDGVDALSFKIYAGDLSDFEFVYNPVDGINKSNVGARFRTNVSEYDFSTVAGYFDERYVAGMDFAGNLYGAGLRGEFIYEFNKNIGSGFAGFVLGLDYQFTNKLYALVEYQYNGEGTTNKEDYMKYFERLAKGEIQNIGRNYLAGSITYQMHPLVSSNVLVMKNLNDWSGFMNLNATWSATDVINLRIGSMFCWGKQKTEYSYYPNAIYLIGEIYF